GRGGLVGVVGGRVEDDADAALAREREQRLAEVRLVQVVGEDVEPQREIGQHFLQDAENALAGGEAEPRVLVLVGERLVRRRRDARQLRRIEEKRRVLRL